MRHRKCNLLRITEINWWRHGLNPLVLLWGCFSSWSLLKICWGATLLKEIVFAPCPLFVHVGIFVHAVLAVWIFFFTLSDLEQVSFPPRSIFCPSSILTSPFLIPFCHLPDWISFFVYHYNQLNKNFLNVLAMFLYSLPLPTSPTADWRQGLCLFYFWIPSASYSAT